MLNRIKRFLSLTLTALMLVNMLPVNALADTTISQSTSFENQFVSRAITEGTGRIYLDSDDVYHIPTYFYRVHSDGAATLEAGPVDITLEGETRLNLSSSSLNSTVASQINNLGGEFIVGQAYVATSFENRTSGSQITSYLFHRDSDYSGHSLRDDSEGSGSTISDITSKALYIGYRITEPAISITPASATVSTDDTVSLTATLENVASDATVVWSSNSAAATVVASSDTLSATVTGQSAGTATITATISGATNDTATDTAVITVYQGAESVTILKNGADAGTSTNIESSTAGSTITTLTATVSPDEVSEGADAITWSTSNPLIASLTTNSDGSVTVKYGTRTSGTAVITATAPNGVKDTYTINVVSFGMDVEPTAVNMFTGDVYFLYPSVTSIDNEWVVEAVLTEGEGVVSFDQPNKSNDNETVITALKAGTAKITFSLYRTDAEGKKTGSAVDPQTVTITVTDNTSTNNHTVSFYDANGVLFATYSVVDGGSVVVPSEGYENTMDGHTFKGFMDIKDNGKAETAITYYNAGSTISGITEDKVYVAKFSAITAQVIYHLTEKDSSETGTHALDTDGDKLIYSDPIEWGGVVEKISDPTAVTDTRKFAGWYDENGNEFDFWSAIKKDTHVYAKYERISYHVTLATYAGTLEDYVFYADGKMADGTTTDTRTVTLYARNGLSNHPKGNFSQYSYSVTVDGTTVNKTAYFQFWKMATTGQTFGKTDMWNMGAEEDGYTLPTTLTYTQITELARNNNWGDVVINGIYEPTSGEADPKYHPLVAYITVRVITEDGDDLGTGLVVAPVTPTLIGTTGTAKYGSANLDGLTVKVYSDDGTKTDEEGNKYTPYEIVGGADGNVDIDNLQVQWICGRDDHVWGASCMGGTWNSVGVATVIVREPEVEGVRLRVNYYNVPWDDETNSEGDIDDAILMKTLIFGDGDDDFKVGSVMNFANYIDQNIVANYDWWDYAWVVGGEDVVAKEGNTYVLNLYYTNWPHYLTIHYKDASKAGTDNEYMLDTQLVGGDNDDTVTAENIYKKLYYRNNLYSVTIPTAAGYEVDARYSNGAVVGTMPAYERELTVWYYPVVTINYAAMVDDGKGNISAATTTVGGRVAPTSETVRVNGDTPNGSTPVAYAEYEFVGWYTDAACETAVTAADGTVGTANKFVPVADSNGSYTKDTYYALFRPANGDLVINKTVTLTGVEAEDYEGGTFTFTVKDAEGNEKTSTITLKAGETSGSVTVEDLELGEATVTETVVGNYKADAAEKKVTVTTGTPAEVAFNNAYEKISVTVTKVWEDASNRDGDRPTSVTVQLYAGGAATGKPLTLNANGNWTGTFEDLDKFAAGSEIQYTVKELNSGVAIEHDGEFGEYDVTYNGNTITNTKKTDSYDQITIEVNKIWSDAENQDGVRPDTATVGLFAKGGTTPLKTDKFDATTSKVTFEVNKFAAGSVGVPAEYEVFELDADGNKIVANGTLAAKESKNYTVTYEGNTGIKGADATVNVTNSYVPMTTSVEVTKAWETNGNDNLIPENVVVQLYADDAATDKTLTLNANGNWTGTFENLPVRANGQDIDYTVDELTVPAGYSKKDITGDAVEGYTITNTLDVVKVSVTKEWYDFDGTTKIAGKDVTATVSVTLTGTAEGAESYTDTKTLTKDATSGEYSVTFTDVPEYAVVNGVAVPYAWSVNENSVSAGWVEMTGNEAATAGADDLAKTYTATIQNKRAVKDITVEKIWTESKTVTPVDVKIDVLQNASIKDGAVAEATNVYISVTLETNNPTETVSNVYTHDLSGNEYIYTVANETFANAADETELVRYQPSYGADLKVTNTLIDGGDLKVEKVLSYDSTAFTAYTATPFTFTLKYNGNAVAGAAYIVYAADGTEVKSGSTGNDGAVTIIGGQYILFTDLAVGSYTVAESADTTGNWKIDAEDNQTQTANVDADGDALTFTNVPQTTYVEIEKVWYDEEATEDRGDNLTVTVIGTANGTKVYEKDVDLLASDGWKATITGLPAKYGSDTISYDIVEPSVPTGYHKDESGELVIVNTATNAVEFSKEWDDLKNFYGRRPEAEDFKAALTLKRTSATGDVETVTTDADGNDVVPTVTDNQNNTYSISYANLPDFNEKNGEKYTYTLHEDLTNIKVENFKADWYVNNTPDGVGEGGALKNELKLVDVEVVKALSNDTSADALAYAFPVHYGWTYDNLEGTGVVGAEIETTTGSISADQNNKVTVTDLPYEATFTVTEDELNNAWTLKSYEPAVAATSGIILTDTDDTTTVTITNERKLFDAGIAVKKEWLTLEDELLPTIELAINRDADKNGNELYATVELDSGNASAGNQYVWTDATTLVNLPIYDVDGTPYTYYIESETGANSESNVLLDKYTSSLKAISEERKAVGVVLANAEGQQTLSVKNELTDAMDSSITVRKDWQDVDAIHPEVTITLTSNEADSAKQAATTSSTTLATEAGEFSSVEYSFSGLNNYFEGVDADGNAILYPAEYGATELAKDIPEGYNGYGEEANIAAVRTDGVYVVTNTIQSGNRKVTVEKTWQNVPAYITDGMTATFKLYRKAAKTEPTDTDWNSESTSGWELAKDVNGNDTTAITITTPAESESAIVNKTIAATSEWTVPVFSADGQKYYYKVVETVSGEAIDSFITEDITQAKKAGDTTAPETVEFTNRYQTGSLSISKTVTGPATTEAEDVFTFKVYDSSNALVKTVTVNAGDSKKIDNLPIGSYTVEEILTDAVNNVWKTTVDGVETLTADRNVAANTESAVTFVNERESRDIVVKKVWLDAGAYRPDSVTLTVNGGTVYTTTVTLSENTEDATKNWMDTVTVPKYDQSGNLLVYTVVEPTVSPVAGEGETLPEGVSYSSVVTPATVNAETRQYTVTNTLTNSNAVEFSKTWNDDSDKYGRRPSAEEFTKALKLEKTANDKTEIVYDFGKVPAGVVTDSSKGTYKISFANLPDYDSNGYPYTYKLTEDLSKINDAAKNLMYSEWYTASTPSVTEGDGKTLVNNIREVTVTVTKNVTDASGLAYKNEAFKIDVDTSFYKRGVAESVVTGVADDRFDGSINLANGAVETYTVPYGTVVTVTEDESHTTEWTVTYGNNGSVPRTAATNAITVNNTRVTREITIEKKWQDNQNALGYRPDSVVVTLTGKAAGASEAFYTNDITLTAADGWTTVDPIDVPTYDNDGNKLVYTVVEKDVTAINVPEGDSSKYVSVVTPETVDAETSEYIVTNTLDDDDDLTISSTKKWNDENDKYGRRPSMATFKGALTVKDGDTAYDLEVTAGSDASTWNITVSKLSRYDGEGKLYTYTLNEDLSKISETIEYDKWYKCSTNNVAVNGQLVNDIQTIEVKVTKNVVDNTGDYNNDSFPIDINASFDRLNSAKNAVEIDDAKSGKVVLDTIVELSDEDVEATETNEKTYTFTAPYGTTVDVSESVSGWTVAYSENDAPKLIADAELTVTNTRDTATLTLTKEWLTLANAEAEVTLTLGRKIATEETYTKVADYTVNALSWTTQSITVPTHDANDNQYTYAIIAESFAGETDETTQDKYTVTGMGGTDSEDTATLTKNGSDTLTIRNELTQVELNPISVTKTWIDEFYQTLPAITFELIADQYDVNGEIKTNYVVASIVKEEMENTAANRTWTEKFMVDGVEFKAPKYITIGNKQQKVNYTIKETIDADRASEYSCDEANPRTVVGGTTSYSFTNRVTTDTNSISIVKAWNKDAWTPDDFTAATFKLYYTDEADPTIPTTVADVTAEDSVWTEYSSTASITQPATGASNAWTGVPTLNTENGKEYTYILVETDVSRTNYVADAPVQKVVFSNNVGSASFSNSYKTGALTVTKTVEDPSGISGNTSFTFELYALINGAETKITKEQLPEYLDNKDRFTITVGALADNTASNSVTIEGLDIGSYVVKEVFDGAEGSAWTTKVGGTTTTAANAAVNAGTTASVEFTNTRKTTSLTVVKKWVDGNGVPLTDKADYPTELNIKLASEPSVPAGAKEYTFKQSDFTTAEWTCTFNNLPTHDADGKEVTYTVSEVVPGKTETIPTDFTAAKGTAAEVKAGGIYEVETVLTENGAPKTDAKVVLVNTKEDEEFHDPEKELVKADKTVGVNLTGGAITMVEDKANLTYTIKWTNPKSTKQNIVVTDILPIGLTVNAAGATPAYDSAVAQEDGTTVLTWNFNDVAPFADGVITVNVTVDRATILEKVDAEDPYFVNVAKVTVGNETRQDSVETHVYNPVMKITKVETTKSDNINGYEVGDAVGYKVTIENKGNVPMLSLEFNDDHVLDYAKVEIDRSKLTDEDLKISVDGKAGIKISAMQPGDSVTFTYEYVVTQADVDAGTITNAAEFSTATDSKPSEPIKEKAIVTVPTYEAAGKWVASDDIAITKTLEGETLTEGKFTFEIKAGEEVVATGANKADGTVEFTAIEYDLNSLTKKGEDGVYTDTFTYTISEVESEDNTINHTADTYTVTVKVTDMGDRTLKSEIIGFQKNGVEADAGSITFDNYKKITAKVTKQWNNVELIDIPTVTINLYRNATGAAVPATIAEITDAWEPVGTAKTIAKADLNEANFASVEWTNLDRVDANDNVYTYIATETVASVNSITQSAEVITLAEPDANRVMLGGFTNTRDQGSLSEANLTISKTIDNGEKALTGEMLKDTFNFKVSVPTDLTIGDTIAYTVFDGEGTATRSTVIEGTENARYFMINGIRHGETASVTTVLPVGTYVVAEQQPASNAYDYVDSYEPAATQTLEAGSTVDYAVTNKVLADGFKLDKNWVRPNGEVTSTEGFDLNGEAVTATFGIYYDADCTEAVKQNNIVLTATTTADGKVIFENLATTDAEGADETYYVKEIETEGHNYVLNGKVIEVKVKDGKFVVAEADQVVVNELKTYELTIVKSIDWANTAKEDVSFEIGYEYYEPNAETATTGVITAAYNAAENKMTYEPGNVLTVPYGTKVTVTETPTAAWTKAITGLDEGENFVTVEGADQVVTVTNTRNLTKAEFTKVWVDGNDQLLSETFIPEGMDHILIPDALNVELLRNGKSFQYDSLEEDAATTATMTSADNRISQATWQIVFGNLPAYDLNGDLYTYEVVETLPENFTTAAVQVVTKDEDGDNVLTAEIRNERGDIAENEPEKDITEITDVYLEGETTQAKAGAEITYTITYTNHLNETADVTIIDELPELTKYVTASNGGAYDEDAHKVTWTIEDAPAFTTGTVTVTIAITDEFIENAIADATANPMVANTASVQIGSNTAVDAKAEDIPVFNPILNVVKTEESAPADGAAYKLGETIEYKIVVTNDGNVTMTDTMVTDDRFDLNKAEITFSNADAAFADGKISVMEPGDKVTFVYTVAVTEALILEADTVEGVIVNNVAVDGTNPDDPTDEESPIDPEDGEDVVIEEPNGHLTVNKVTTSKPANGETYALGETIKYEITVTNDGNLTITGITVTDELTGDEWTIESLAPAASKTFTAEYVVTEADLENGSVLNVATAKGTSPDPEQPDVPVVPGEVEEPTDDPKPAYTVVKTLTNLPERGYFVLGETAEFEITVTNTGNVTLDEIVITEMLAGATFADGSTVAVIKDLAPSINGSTDNVVVLKAQYTITEADLGNDELANSLKSEATYDDPTDPEQPVGPDPIDPEPIPVDDATAVTVTKVWNDQENAFGTRKTVNVSLLADGKVWKTAQISTEDVWSFTFEQLPVHNADASVIEYTAVEDAVAGYDASYEVDETGSNITITNELQKYTVTINYWYGQVGGAAAAETFTRTYFYGESYNVASPNITGYSVDKARVEGVVTGDVQADVIYTAIDYRLTVYYVYEDGTTAATTHRDTLNINDRYSVTSPVLEGYVASKRLVSGTMPGRNLVYTVIYVPDTVVIDEYGTPLNIGSVVMNVGDCFE